MQPPSLDLIYQERLKVAKFCNRRARSMYRLLYAPCQITDDQGLSIGEWLSENQAKISARSVGRPHKITSLIVYEAYCNW